MAYAAIDRGAKGLERDYVDALKQVLSSDIEDAMKAQLLSLPTEASLADRAAQTGLVNVHDIHDAKTNVAAAVGHALSNELEAIVMSSLAVTDTYQPSAEQIGRRHCYIPRCPYWWRGSRVADNGEKHVLRSDQLV